MKNPSAEHARAVDVDGRSIAFSGEQDGACEVGWTPPKKETTVVSCILELGCVRTSLAAKCHARFNSACAGRRCGQCLRLKNANELHVVGRGLWMLDDARGLTINQTAIIGLSMT